MSRQQTVADDRPRNELKGSDGARSRTGPWLAAALVAVAAVVAGFLLGRRRGGSEGASAGGDGRVPLTDAASRVRERVTAVVGAATDVETGTAPGDSTAHDLTEEERERLREEADALSAPTVRGMPTLGVGTYDDADYDECVATVRQALDVGYRHVDAIEQRESYYGEVAVGDAVDDADVTREDVFLATKVNPADLDFDHVLTSVEESLDRLGTDYLDLLYVHWPTDEYDPDDTLAAFAQLREEGVVERIGVSNFTVDLLAEAIDASPEPIFANQVEMHPLLPQTELRDFCDRDDVDVELVAYSPIARGDVEDVDELQAVADKHDASPEQVSLAWLREKGVTAVPRATSEAHLLENWLSLGLELDDEDVATRDAIEERRRIVDPADAPWNR